MTSAVDLRSCEGIALATRDHSAAEGATWQAKRVAERSEVHDSRSVMAFKKCLIPTEAD